ncbi:hypothetical protein BTVI_150421 [Pitangus sulphuratus]|nr:hypothetical protein BTVI_150421 [Pitangus sulphuratus]
MLLLAPHGGIQPCIHLVCISGHLHQSCGQISCRCVLRGGSDPRNDNSVYYLGYVDCFVKEVSSKKTEAGRKVIEINQDYFIIVVVVIIIIIVIISHKFQMVKDNLSAFTAAGGPRFTGFYSEAIGKHWTQFMSDAL